MDKKKFAFSKTNYILLAIGVAIIIVGLLLMTGPSCTNQTFEPDIFSPRRIKLAPLVTLLGFVEVIAAIAYKPKDKSDSDAQTPKL